MENGLVNLKPTSEGKTTTTTTTTTGLLLFPTTTPGTTTLPVKGSSRHTKSSCSGDYSSSSSTSPFKVLVLTPDTLPPDVSSSAPRKRKTMHEPVSSMDLSASEHNDTTPPPPTTTTTNNLISSPPSTTTSTTTTNNITGDENHSIKPPSASTTSSSLVVESEDTLRSLLCALTHDQMLQLLTSFCQVHTDVYDAAMKIAKASPASRRLMVRNISFNTTDETFRNLFQAIGQVEDCAIVRERPSGKSKGFGFITFKELHAVTKALTSTFEVDGRNWFIKLAGTTPVEFNAPAMNAAGRCKLFVRNLCDTMNDGRLLDEFSTFGYVQEAVVVKDTATGKSRGYGFVTYRNHEDAVKALRQPQRVIDGRMAFISLATAAAGNARKQDPCIIITGGGGGGSSSSGSSSSGGASSQGPGGVVPPSVAIPFNGGPPFYGGGGSPAMLPQQQMQMFGQQGFPSSPAAAVQARQAMQQQQQQQQQQSVGPYPPTSLSFQAMGCGILDRM